MRGLILALLIGLPSLAHADQPQQVIDIQHDARRGVTCWILPGTGISCLPDSQLERQQNVTPDHINGSPSPASNPTPRKRYEKVQL